MTSYIIYIGKERFILDKIKIQECPYCGSKDLSTGYQYAQGSVYPELWE